MCFSHDNCKGLVVYKPGLWDLVEDGSWHPKICSDGNIGKASIEFQLIVTFPSASDNLSFTLSISSLYINNNRQYKHHVGWWLVNNWHIIFILQTNQKRSLDYVRATDLLTIQVDTLKLEKEIKELKGKSKDSEYGIDAKLLEKDKQISILAKKQEKFQQLIQSLIESGQLKPVT